MCQTSYHLDSSAHPAHDRITAERRCKCWDTAWGCWTFCIWNTHFCVWNTAWEIPREIKEPLLQLVLFQNVNKSIFQTKFEVCKVSLDKVKLPRECCGCGSWMHYWFCKYVTKWMAIRKLDCTKTIIFSTKITTRHRYSPLNVQRSYENKSSEVICFYVLKYSIYIPKSGA